MWKISLLEALNVWKSSLLEALNAWKNSLLQALNVWKNSLLQAIMTYLVSAVIYRIPRVKNSCRAARPSLGFMSFRVPLLLVYW